ncbi:MAG: YccF domain-containing protein [Ignavibacteriales bacterium]|nr:MAG: YccF domain-containing protein [Ignavibacteriaceae bacterium]MBW7873425.1 YccF domain-containing protein [Ignavibacteria bacterium]MCZ2142116.1 YccF domain-containing protein [Ignavibacteriales bacterium]OQY75690.1 MAG: hypothetical protein B6D45_05365 [Ignavibacteriales bacterium UTCHB3]MBZ0197025.1 YccF domain-containing protein [Ignavibacteriaceae bacterium]
MSCLGNVIWFFCGGLWMGLAWYFIGFLMFISVIGIPFGKACFTIGKLSFWPFGKEIVDRKTLTGHDDIGTGCLGSAGNIIWMCTAGWVLALGHVMSGIFTAITIIGIPFAIQHFKLAKLSFWPIGKEVVDKK